MAEFGKALADVYQKPENNNQSNNENKLKEAASFYGSRIATLLMDMGIMFVFVTLLHLNDKIMKLVVQIVVTVANYVLSKLFVFKKNTSNIY